MEDLQELIKLYFTLGLQQAEILSCLSFNHGINISHRTLKRKLKKMSLYRRKGYSQIDAVVRFIEETTKRHGQLHGYRWIHLKCLQNNLTVTQETVRLLLQIIDPEGVEIRSRKRLRRRQYRNNGPNFLWHMDCYDKLKPYGICISGCIDGFSRKIMWLRAGKNSNDPKVIAGYYLETIEICGGCPQTVRADCGTENGVVSAIQTTLRETYEQRRYSLPPFLYGTSPNNQRIESWWAILRKHHAQFWMNLFQSIKDDGLFSGSFLDKSLIQFCFLNMIQEELDTVMTEWNMHRISGSRNSISPRGRPFILYHIPQIYGTIDYMCDISCNDIASYQDLCIFSNRILCDSDVFELATLLMDEHRLPFPKHPNDAVDLYKALRELFLSII